MEDKEGMKKAVAGVMTDASADGRKPATASNLPPLSNRGGTETEAAGRVQEVFECYETYITDGKGNLSISSLQLNLYRVRFLRRLPLHPAKYPA